MVVEQIKWHAKSRMYWPVTLINVAPFCHLTLSYEQLKHTLNVGAKVYWAAVIILVWIILCFITVSLCTISVSNVSQPYRKMRRHIQTTEPFKQLNWRSLQDSFRWIILGNFWDLMLIYEEENILVIRVQTFFFFFSEF